MNDLQILPKCPDCGRLTVDNPQHCPEKKPAAWAKFCQWRTCAGTVTNADGVKVRCRRVYGSPAWPGFRQAS